MPSGFSLYSARSAVNLRTVSARSEEASVNRPADGTGDRHITSRSAIIECDSVLEIITVQRGLYQRMYLASKTRGVRQICGWLQYPQRQLGDLSSPAYTETRHRNTRTR